MNINISLSKNLRVGLFGCLFVILGMISFYHFSMSFGKSPKLEPTLYGGPRGQMGMSVQIMGTDINAPIKDFSEKFNSLLEEQDKERNKDFLVAGFADAAGAIAALISMLIEATNREENTKNNKDKKTQKTN